MERSFKNIISFKFRYTPYAVIALFCLIAGAARAAILVDLAWYYHVMLYLIHFAVFVSLWKLMQFLNRFLDKKISFSTSPVTRVSLQVLLSICFIIPVFISSIYLMQPHFPGFVTRPYIVMISILFFVAILMMNFGFYTNHFFKEWQRSVEEKAAIQVKTAEIEKEKFLMQFHHLKNQVNPHFLFNTFTSLDGLIQSDPALASEFVRHLSKVYRYVLEHKENEIVSVETELNFIEHYIELLTIRYKSALHINIDITTAGKEKSVAMVTLQMLIDNAIKHNVVHAESPLQIWIWDEGDYLFVRNNKQLRKQLDTSTKHGLLQLSQLYSYVSPQSVTVTDGDIFFEIKLPLL